MKSALIIFGYLLSFSTILSAAPAAIQLQSPREYQVVQRDRPTSGLLQIAGRLARPAAKGTRLVTRIDEGEWLDLLELKAGERSFRAEQRIDQGGWFRFEIQVMIGDEIVESAEVEHLGVGEIFVIAGQSNSANHGEEKQRVSTGMVANFNGESWQIAHDPQPGGSGRGGSFIPSFGDAMVSRFKVPVGIITLGVGATSVREWLPEGARFPNPPTILKKVSKHPEGGWMSDGKTYANLITRLKPLGRDGFRAFLWHQGESDANQKDASRTLPGDLYRQYLNDLISATRRDLGWKCPWFVAQASYHNESDPGSPEIRAAQKALWESGVAHEGPDTDGLAGANRDRGGKGVHFSAVGLRAHGQAWVEKVSPWLVKELEKRIKVFILAGQSNMEGQGVVSMDHKDHYNGGKGNLVWSMENSPSKDVMKHLRDSDGNWVERDDVEISFKAKGKVRRGPLTIGYTGYGGSSHIGPELQFGHVMGGHFDDPVLLIKTAWGGKSLSQDFRPPSSGGETGPYYQQMIGEIRAELSRYDRDQYEIAGFVWMQGWNDMVSKEATTEYAENLVNLAADVRKEFGNERLPFVIGELGNGGEAREGSGMAAFRTEQKKGAEKIKFAAFVPTTQFARPKELSPNVGHGHHWFGNAESYFLVGDELARRMIKLQPE